MSNERPQFHTVTVVGDDGGGEYRKHAKGIHSALRLAEKDRNWLADVPDSALFDTIQPEDATNIVSSGGCIHPVAINTDSMAIARSYDEFRTDFETFYALLLLGPIRSVCDGRLHVLGKRFELHRDLNANAEDNHHAVDGGGDVGAAAKLDVRRIGTAMSAKHLVAFVQDAIRHRSHDIVAVKPSGKEIYLSDAADEYFGGPGSHKGAIVTAEGLCIRPNYTHATSKRLDIFEKGQPLRPRGDRALRFLRHFLKYQWGGDGLYLAELVSGMSVKSPANNGKTSNGAAGGPQLLELELTVHGMRPGELAMIGEWALKHKLLGGSETAIGAAKAAPVAFVLRIVQRHRSQHKYDVTSFDDVLQNLFAPLWAAAINPEKNPGVAYLLSGLRAVSIAIDHSGGVEFLPIGVEPRGFKSSSSLPPDHYFAYFITQNVRLLNRFLQSRGLLSPLQVRLHCESNQFAALHCATGLLIADVLHNPVALGQQPSMAYVAYLRQTPTVFSPSVSNGTGTPFQEHPLADLLRIGLNVSLATMDPLHFHESDAPLEQEYQSAAKNFFFSPTDLCEMAMRGIVSANIPIGAKYEALGPVANPTAPIEENAFAQSRVPTMRLVFRAQSLESELSLLSKTIDKDVALMAPMRLFASPPVKRMPQTKMSADPASCLCPTCAVKPELLESETKEAAVEARVKFPRIVIVGPQMISSSYNSVSRALTEAIEMRARFQSFQGFESNSYFQYYQARSHRGANEESLASPQEAKATEQIRSYTTTSPIQIDGVLTVPDLPVGSETLPTYTEYRSAYGKLRALVHDATAQVFCRRRLNMLGHKFGLHAALVEHENEKSLASIRLRGDAYRCIKVDNHIHMAAGVTGTDLLDFIREKVTHHSDDIIMMDDRGEPVTLGYFFNHVLQIDVNELSVAALDVQADRSTFNRFDQFNQKYNPLGMSMLRSLFLKTDNFMQGRYFAELIHRTFARQAQDRTTFTECRLSIYGKAPSEWKQLAQWFITHGMSATVNKWIIQIPRIYPIYRKAGVVRSFGHMLDNLFRPLWEVSIAPQGDPFLTHFLENISGFDTVDNESSVDAEGHEVRPEDWTSDQNPSYSYWAYHIWANIAMLNRFRRTRGLSTFSFRPHCGESGDPDHLIDGFLLANSVNHGINLRFTPVLTHLFYLTQIGLSITPLSNNALFCPYEQNPFPAFFNAGLNVALSTDGPLTFHTTQQPLLEEYGTAQKFWKLSLTDICEIAVNSIRQCGYSVAQKKKWLGKLCLLSSSVGNDPHLSHLPDHRPAFRFEVYHEEIRYIESRAQRRLELRAMPDVVDEDVMAVEEVGMTRAQIQERKARELRELRHSSVTTKARVSHL